MSHAYSDQFPLLSKVTNGLDPRLLRYVGENIKTFSVNLQIEYAAYRQYQQEYEDWIDSKPVANFVRDY